MPSLTCPLGGAKQCFAYFRLAHELLQIVPARLYRVSGTGLGRRACYNAGVVLPIITEVKYMTMHYDQAEGLCNRPDPETRRYLFNQTMLRIKDPARSLDFYTRVLGMSLIKRCDFPEMKFTLYFLGMTGDGYGAEIPSDPARRMTWVFSQEAMLELTHNWGTESDPAFAYHHGNSDPRGFGHIGFTVPDVYAACERFKRLGVEFVKRPDDGRMKGIAFIRDPDGYWIEILQADMAERRAAEWGARL